MKLLKRDICMQFLVVRRSSAPQKHIYTSIKNFAFFFKYKNVILNLIILLFSFSFSFFLLYSIVFDQGLLKRVFVL